MSGARLPLSYPTLQIGLVILAYHLFWFLLCTMVIAWGKSSSFNATMETFHTDYPEFRKYPIPEKEYSSSWYYAMQYAGEVESGESAGQLFINWRKGNLWRSPSRVSIR